jgi:hypothetical protein
MGLHQCNQSRRSLAGPNCPFRTRKAATTIIYFQQYRKCMSQIEFREISHPADPRKLAEWLNDRKGTEEASRVLLLLEDVRESVALARKVYQHALDRSPEGALNSHHGAVVKKINERLLDYRVSPQIAPPIGPGMWLAPTWIPVNFGRNLSSVWSLSKTGRVRRDLKATMDEIEVVLAILVLARDGRLDRLKQCKQCHEWFYARVLHQEFHELKCQQAFYKSSDEWRAHRRLWMQDYRRAKESGCVK